MALLIVPSSLKGLLGSFGSPLRFASLEPAARMRY